MFCFQDMHRFIPLNNVLLMIKIMKKDLYYPSYTLQIKLDVQDIP